MLLFFEPKEAHFNNTERNAKLIKTHIFKDKKKVTDKEITMKKLNILYNQFF